MADKFVNILEIFSPYYYLLSEYGLLQNTVSCFGNDLSVALLFTYGFVIRMPRGLGNPNPAV